MIYYYCEWRLVTSYFQKSLSLIRKEEGKKQYLMESFNLNSSKHHLIFLTFQGKKNLAKCYNSLRYVSSTGLSCQQQRVKHKIALAGLHKPGK